MHNTLGQLTVSRFSFNNESQVQVHRETSPPTTTMLNKNHEEGKLSGLDVDLKKEYKISS